MTAAAVNPFADSPVPPLPPEATPAAIRGALVDPERAEFEHAYHDALAQAARTMDLAPVFDVLRNYLRIAKLTKLQGPEAHQRMLEQAAHALRTGEAPAGSASAEDMRKRIDRRLGQ